jgi:hypothetical protein
MPRFSLEEIHQIRKHRLDTTAYVLLREANCFGLKPADFTKVAGRRLVPIGADQLPVHPLPKSWVLVVLVCPGDDLDALAAWAARLTRADLHRVWFYELHGQDARRSYKPWVDAGLQYPPNERVDDVQEFNHVFANELNIRILLDHPL